MKKAIDFKSRGFKLFPGKDNSNKFSICECTPFLLLISSARVKFVLSVLFVCFQNCWCIYDGITDFSLFLLFAWWISKYCSTLKAGFYKSGIVERPIILSAITQYLQRKKYSASQTSAEILAVTRRCILIANEFYQQKAMQTKACIHLQVCKHLFLFPRDMWGHILMFGCFLFLLH